MSSTALKRPKPPRALISLVPMIDVMLILLVFFMVTSTYLNLDMIPAVQRADRVPPTEAAPNGEGGSLMIRIAADGAPVIRGRTMTPDSLQAELVPRVAEDPLMQVLILPSKMARTQALISVMEAATLAGVTRLRVVRLEARQ